MKVKQTLYIQAEKWSFDKGFQFYINSHKCKSDNSRVVVDIAEHELEVEIPDVTDSEFTEKHIKQLRQMRIEVLAENHIRLQKVDGEIASLLAIEGK